MNIEALNKTIALMEKDVSETGIDFDLNSWSLTRDQYEKFGTGDLPQFENHACGTVACFAGYINLANDPNGNVTGATTSRAIKLSGLKEELAYSLFTPRVLPKGIDYNNMTRQDAIKVLKHLRDTGLVDWSVISEDAS